jgi:RNA polymerase sigma factor (sigma-70 family)
VREKPSMQEEFNTENILWRQFKEGNQNAFYRLYDQYADNLFRYGTHFSKDKEFIKDCIHDLFLELYKYRKKLSDTNNVQFYLFRAFRRIIHKGQIKMIPFRNDQLNFAPNNNLEFPKEDFLIAEETEIENHKVLVNAIATLSNRQREGLSLKFEHDLSYAEIAEIMGVSIESSRTIIYRALKELRKCIAEKGQSVQFLFFLYRHVSC